MNDYRFYLPDLRDLLGSGHGPVSLSPDQAHHARGVLRLETGENVVLFDGMGAWAAGTVETVGKKDVRIKASAGIVIDPPPPLHLTLATAVPKGDRAEWLIEQASQLNVAAVQWLNCDRGVVKPRDNGGKMEKWRRLAVESAKQCHRTHLMQIHDLTTLPSLLARPDSKILWLDPSDSGGCISQALTNITTGKILALIGPEGGWSDAERHLLETNASANKITRIRLTSTILRIETACAAVAALVMDA